MSAEEAMWAATVARYSASDIPLELDDLTSNPGRFCRLPWLSSIWDAGVGGHDFVPGFVRKHVAFWEDVILADYPLRNTLVSYLRDGVDVHDFRFDSNKGPLSNSPCNRDRFPGPVLANRIPLQFTEFVDMEMQSLIDSKPGWHFTPALCNGAVSGGDKTTPDILRATSEQVFASRYGFPWTRWCGWRTLRHRGVV